MCMVQVLHFRGVRCLLGAPFHCMELSCMSLTALHRPALPRTGDSLAGPVWGGPGVWPSVAQVLEGVPHLPPPICEREGVR